MVSTAYNQNICLLKDTGEIYCTGEDSNGSKANRPIDDQFNIISSGDGFNCAISRTNQELRCWGTDHNSVITNAPDPTIDTYQSISLGYRHGCAISATTGELYCWGSNSHQQVSNQPGDSTYIMVASGTYHSCVVRFQKDVVTKSNDLFFNISSEYFEKGNWGGISYTLFTVFVDFSLIPLEFKNIYPSRKKQFCTRRKSSIKFVFDFYQPNVNQSKH